MATINDLMLAYLQDETSETGTIADLESINFPDMSDAEIQQFYVDLSPLTPVEDFTVNDHMFAGLGGLSAADLDIMYNNNIFILDGNIENMDIADIGSYNFDFDITKEFDGSRHYLHVVNNIVDNSIYLEFTAEDNIPGLTPFVGGDNELWTAYVELRGDPSDKAIFNLWRYTDDDSDDAPAPVTAGATNHDDGGANTGLYYADYDDAPSMSSEWLALYFHFRAPATTTHLGFEVYDQNNNGYLDISKMGIWKGTSTTWRP